jgi:hypothetical protein
MPVPSSIDDLNVVESSNSPQGTETAKGVIDNYFRRHASFIAVLRDALTGKAALSDLAASAGASLIGFLQAGTGAVLRSVQDKFRDHYDAKDFGAVCDGVTDDTAAIVKLIAHCKTNSKRAELSGTIAAKTIAITDAIYNFTLHGNNVTLYSIDTAAQEGFITLTNCVDFRMTGAWHIYGQDATNYASMVRIKAVAGTSQAATRISVEGVTVRRAANAAFWIGTDNNDYQCSEITLTNCHAFQTNVFVRGEGSQAGATFVGCTLVAEQNPALGTRPLQTCLFKGGFWYIVGGELVQTSAAAGDVALECRPCNSAPYHNPYPIVKVANCHVESSGVLLYINNIDGRTTPRSDCSSMAFSNCGGYVASGGPHVIDSTGDNTYAGKIALLNGCDFYGDFGVNRTAAHIVLGTNTRLDIDGTPFGQSFKPGLSGIDSAYSGKPRLRGETILAMYGATTSIAATGGTVVNFPSITVTPDSGYGLTTYSAGSFPAPQSLKDVQISFQLSFATAAANADVWVAVNGTAVYYAPRVSDTLRSGCCIIPALASGDIVTVRANTNTGAAIALTGGQENFLRIAARTN